MAAGNPLVFKAEAVVIPEVNLADYKKIAQKTKPKKKEDIKVEEKEMSDSLEWLRKSRAKYITMARPARLGDRVEIDFSAHGGPASGEETGQNQTNISESKNHPLILGKSRFIKGFDENLVDMKEKEEKNFSLMFPEDYHQKHLAGKLADFKVKMNLVQEQELPELNDEFAKGLGGFENLEKLKENIREGILMEKETEEKKNWQEKIISEIIAKSSMDLPDLLVESEAEKMLEEAKINVGNMGLPWENYLEQAGKTEQALKKELQVPAEKRVKGTLILREIAKQEKIETSDEEMEKEMNTLLKQFPDPEAAKKQIDIEQLKSYTYEMIRNRKVFELLESIAN
jgi:trigger factor